MTQYPGLEINTKVIYKNACILRKLCLSRGIEPTGVIKGFDAIPAIVDAVCEAGYSRLASSHLPHLRALKQRDPGLKTLALRLPMLSEVDDVVEWADMSLNSEEAVLRALDGAARRRGVTHGVTLMRDLGDLREGVMQKADLLSLALLVEKNLPNLHLLGVGANLNCYGTVRPTVQNLSKLASEAKEIEDIIGRKLEIVSGGSTSSLPLVADGSMPDAINDLRIGEALVVPCDLIDYWQTNLPGLSNKGLILRAEIIEIGEKPTMPIGEHSVDAFGVQMKYEDRGIRKRALLALGVFDVGDEKRLIPLDSAVHVLGGSSDHLIMDIHDSQRDYKLGDTMDFELHYKGMLFASSSVSVKKIIVD